MTSDGSHRLRQSGTAALIGLCLGIVLLVVSGCLLVDHPAGPATSIISVGAGPPPTSTTAPATATSPAAAPVTGTGSGMAFGKVTANDGTTFVVQNPLTSSSVKIRSNAVTKVYVLVASRAADIPVGALVAVYGQRQSDRSIVATFITGFSIGTSAK